MQQPQVDPNDPWQGVPPDQMPSAPSSSRRFRWEWIGIPIACLVLAWMAAGVKVGFSWPSVMSALNVQDTDRYTQLAIIGVALVAVAVVWRVYRNGRDEN